MDNFPNGVTGNEPQITGYDAPRAKLDVREGKSDSWGNVTCWHVVESVGFDQTAQRRILATCGTRKEAEAKLEEIALWY